jgi:hypothetical protein
VRTLEAQSGESGGFFRMKASSCRLDRGGSVGGMAAMGSDLYYTSDPNLSFKPFVSRVTAPSIGALNAVDCLMRPVSTLESTPTGIFSQSLPSLFRQVNPSAPFCTFSTVQLCCFHGGKSLTVARTILAWRTSLIKARCLSPC